jgi:hypothetical protein
METLQVCEVSLPAPKRQEQDLLRKDPLLARLLVCAISRASQFCGMRR